MKKVIVTFLQFLLLFPHRSKFISHNSDIFLLANLSYIYIYIYTHTHTHTHTLTGHFIRYTLLVTGLTPFCLQNCLNSSWHRFNKVLETFLRDFGHIDMIASHSCCRFVGCTSMMLISRSSTSQRCSIGLRSGDCGGHLSKVNSCHVQETSLRWFELCDMMHYPAGSSHQKMVHCSHKGMDMVSNNTQVDCGV